jgi:hypothetical protein
MARTLAKIRKIQKTRKAQKVKKTRKAQKKTRRNRRPLRPMRSMKGGFLRIDSVSAENENDTIVTVRPDADDEDSIPMTGRLTVMREILENQ